MWTFTSTSFSWSNRKSPRAHLHVVEMLRFMSFTKTSRARAILLVYSCVCFCLFGPFNCISFHKVSRQHHAFSLCSSGLISALLVLSTIYLFLKVSLSPDMIICGWLGLKHQLTNKLTVRVTTLWNTSRQSDLPHHREEEDSREISPNSHCLSLPLHSQGLHACAYTKQQRKFTSRVVKLFYNIIIPTWFYKIKLTIILDHLCKYNLE